MSDERPARNWVLTCSCGCAIHVKNAGIVRSKDPCGHCADLSDMGIDDDGRVASELGWCGCGTTGRVDELMLAYLTSGEEPYQNMPKAEGDIGLLLAYIADELGWTEHGGSVFGAWLTDAGKEAVANLTAAVNEGAP